MKRKIGMPKTLLLAMIVSMAVVPIIISTPAMAQVSLRLQGNPAAPQVNTTADHDDGKCEVLNTSTSPHKDCTLREAIAFANPGARVRFNQTVFATAQTIALSERGLLHQQEPHDRRAHGRRGVQRQPTWRRILRARLLHWRRHDGRRLARELLPATVPRLVAAASATRARSRSSRAPSLVTWQAAAAKPAAASTTTAR